MSPEITSIVESSRSLAQAGGWTGVTVEHVFLAILDDERGRSMLSQAGANVVELRMQIEGILRGAPKRGDIAMDPSPWIAELDDQDVTRKRGSLTIGSLIWHLMNSQTAVAPLLAAQGVAGVDILNLVVHGISRTTTIPSARIVRGGGQLRADKRALYRVVFHNDQFTTVEFVCDVLDQHVGMGHDAARTFATEVDQTGSASLGPYKLKHALKLIDLVTREAHAAGFPLKLSCEAIPG
jgi:ATP-dependent Clp protease adaptor protein ClpS